MSTLPLVHTVVVRVWLPDRPGALGQVASRVGAVKGDVLAIEILEVGGGRVIDELVVALPDEELVDLMVNEVHAIDGVSVEHVRPLDGGYSDGGLLALSLAAEVAEAGAGERLDRFADAVQRLTESEWTMVVRDGDVVAGRGEIPNAEFVASLMAGSRHLLDPGQETADLFWSDLPHARAWVAAGRPDRPIHERERVRLDLFTRVADPLLVARADGATGGVDP
ncbi:MAG: hypothetical protein CL424_14030 [Acidimicrobiaceae bacterium]|nr:hypothetical protein [Acidimicrobiaceae bacterium]